MIATEPAPVVTLGNILLTPTGVFRRLHQRGRLVPLLREAVVEQVVLEQAKQTNLSVSTSELQQAADLFRHRHGLASAEQTRQWLAREHLTVADFEAGLERDLLIARFKRHLTEPHVAGHFAAHKGRYAKVQLRQVVVGSEEVARELLAQLTDEGRDFAALAREHSLDAPSRLAGGSLGLVPRAALPPPAADAVFGAKAGELVGPFAGAQGVHLFLVEDLPEPALDDETAAAIREELFAAWLREKMRDVRIDLSWLSNE
jgi:parvulin-like peptidyl-prolyl isomerase